MSCHDFGGYRQKYHNGEMILFILRIHNSFSNLIHSVNLTPSLKNRRISTYQHLWWWHGDISHAHPLSLARQLHLSRSTRTLRSIRTFACSHDHVEPVHYALQLELC